MIKSNVNLMKKGWFIGNFDPSLYKTNNFEVAYKLYKSGDKESSHFHRIATEFTVVVSGKIKMFNQIFVKGDIVIVEPNESTCFEALENSETFVIKVPGVNNDKYLTE